MKKGRKRKNSQIRGIFFDLGGVCVVIDQYHKTLVGQGSSFGVPIIKLDHIIAEEIGKIEKGKETGVQFWRRVAKKLKVPPLPDKIPKSLFFETFKKHARVNTRTLAIARKLRCAGYPVGIISNTIDDHVAIMKTWKLFEYFDPVILSNKAHTRKPERKIFMFASRKMGIQPKHLLLIDDARWCLAGARACGFKTILFKSPAQLEKRLRKMRVLD